MKKLIFVLMLVGLLSVVQGSQDVVELGPYDVSFDLGDLNYTVELGGPYEGETYRGFNYTDYKMLISINGSPVFEITGCQFSNNLYSGFGELYDITKNGDEMEAYVRTIDDKNAVLFVKSSGLMAIYSLESNEWIDSDGTFTANYRKDQDAILLVKNQINIISVADWDLARKLLNTIHVELRDES